MKGGAIRDQGSLEAELGRMDRRTRDLSLEDVVIGLDRRLLIRSPNGTYFAIVVSDAGALSTVNVGAQPL
ncbi:MAG TPA: hypothetical protein VF638_02260 [Sphingomonas sp.]|jgi:hypothetical protein